MAIATPTQLEAHHKEPETWAVRSLRAAADFDASFDDAATLQAHVAGVVAVARDCCASVIEGASAPGEGVATSARAEMGLSRGRIDRGGTVLLVDGFVNTGIQLDLARRRAVEAGATRVVCLGLVTQEGVALRWRAQSSNLSRSRP